MAERERERDPREDPLESGRIPWGPSVSLPSQSSENLEVPRIWEVEGPGSKIMNPINNDYWVHNSALVRPLEESLH